IVQIAPKVAHVRQAVAHAGQGEGLGADRAAFELVPRARCRNRSAGEWTDGVGRCERGAILVPAGIDEDPAAAVDLAELLRELLWMTTNQLGSPAMGEPRHRLDVGGPIEGHDDVESLGAGGLDPTVQAELEEQVAKAERRGAQDGWLVSQGIEI